jgi:hypothetical protein
MSADGSLPLAAIQCCHSSVICTQTQGILVSSPALAGAQVDNFRRQFDHLDNGGQGRPPGPNLGQATSLPRERVREFQHEAARYMQVGADTGHSLMVYMPPLLCSQAGC